MLPFHKAVRSTLKEGPALIRKINRYPVDQNFTWLFSGETGQQQMSQTVPAQTIFCQYKMLLANSFGKRLEAKKNEVHAFFFPSFKNPKHCNIS